MNSWMSGHQSFVLLAYSSSSLSDESVTFLCFLLGGIQSKADQRFVVNDKRREPAKQEQTLREYKQRATQEYICLWYCW